jgi:hypothetical protein
MATNDKLTTAGDVEAGEKDRLIKGRSWLEEYESTPVGGVPGNHDFYDQIAIAGRCALCATILGCGIWIKGLDNYIDEGFLRYIPFAVLMIFFMMQWVFGNIIGSCTAAIIGTFWPVLNIFILRGFFPDGVTPGMKPWSTESIVGWVDLALFNFIFLTTDMRMPVRMFAMGSNTTFMLCFLNPADQTVFSKNFQINPNGTAVLCLKMTCIACFLTLLANLLPTPFKFAFYDMKKGAKRVSAYMAKSYIQSVDYYRGATRTVLIQRQIKNSKNVEAAIDNLSSSINGAFYEGFDVGVFGKIRFLHQRHNDLMGELLSILRALLICMQTEDFAESHVALMRPIAEPCSKLMDDTGELLMMVTSSAGDGELDANEKDELRAKVDMVKDGVKVVANSFNQVRQTFIENAPPIHREALNESFFVFAISAYARKVSEYTEELLEDKVQGQSFLQMVWKEFRATFTLEGVGEHHGKIATRSWCALMIGVIYGVLLDNYSGACAVTLVFLISNRVAPAIWTLLNSLIAATLASVMAAIIYQRACSTPVIGSFTLPVAAFFFWWLSLYVHFSGCQFALIGILCAALSPFVLVVRCPLPEEVSGSAGALPLWYMIRGFMMALLIMSVAEYLSSGKSMGELATHALDEAIECVQEALKQVFSDEDPAEAMAPIGKIMGKIKDWNTAARSEPRFWNCRWKGELLDEVASFINIMQLDLGTIRHAMSGADGKTGGVVKVLQGIEGYEQMQTDIHETMSDARDLTFTLLDHRSGEYTGFQSLKHKEGVDTLDGVDEAIAQMSAILKFPTEEIITIEDDMLCQLSIIFVMLEYATSRIGGIIKACVRRC